jgi:hypothetical protein
LNLTEVENNRTSGLVGKLPNVIGELRGIRAWARLQSGNQPAIIDCNLSNNDAVGLSGSQVDSRRMGHF